MKKVYSILALILAFACVFSLAACSGKTEQASASPASTSSPAASGGGASSAGKTFHIGVNVWGTAPVLTAYGNEEEYAIKAVGMTDDRASDDNNADKELQNIQNFISQGVNGLCIQGAGAAASDLQAAAKSPPAAVAPPSAATSPRRFNPCVKDIGRHLGRA